MRYCIISSVRIHGQPGAGKPASLADCFYWSSGKLTIHKYTPERRTERPHSASSTHTGHCTHGIAHDKHSVRWHCHGRVKSACDDADDGTAVAVWAHAGQHAKGSREERGRSLLLLLLPVFPRRFHDPCRACCLLLALVSFDHENRSVEGRRRLPNAR